MSISTGRKQRRTSMSSTTSLASRGGGDLDDASGDMDYQPDSKRKRILKMDPIEQCQQLYDIIRNHKKEDGTILCEPFIRVPKRRQEPEYYTVVNNPMGMLQIQQKIKMDEYEDIDQMSADCDLMVTNAKAFYKKSSQEYKDACDLWDLFIESKSRLFDFDSGTDEGERKGKIILKMGKLARRAAALESRKPLPSADDGETSESSTNTEKDKQEDEKDNQVPLQLEELFAAVMEAQDGDSRLLNTDFQLLPSKKVYPKYYELIENPIDLKMIATRIQRGEYGNLQEQERDLLLMCRNACNFNEPGSQIYNDAKALKKVVMAKKVEIEQGRFGQAKTSERIRTRRLKSGLSHSSVVAALQYDDSSEEEEMEEDGPNETLEDECLEEEDEDEESKFGDMENPMWALYDAVSSCTAGASGKILSAPFQRLPSRRYYPDYYTEIKHPISLAQIKMKIKRGEYANISQLQADLDTMFENAKTYNRPDSSLYKWAVKLQKVMQSKVDEIIHDDDEYDDTSSRDFDERSPPVLEISTSSKDSWSIRTPQSGKKNIFKKTSTRETTPSGSIKGKDVSKLNNAKELLRMRFMALYSALIEYKEADGRIPISVFMEKPSKKLYPDYFKIITEPIDMITIEQNIKSDKYSSTTELMRDFTLMFNNCRTYNEEGSVIFDDANSLEKRLSDKLREVGPEPGKQKKKPRKNYALMPKLQKLLDTLKEYKDKNDRVVSSIFQKLPSRMEYPGYYEVIKSPIDLERICHKVRMGSYETLDQLAHDLMLMFDNACKFNEPDSQIYKDALVLQRLTLQTKLSLAEDDDRTPDVPGAVREIMISIFTSVYNHQDEEGRCFTDTMAELPEFDEVAGEKIRAISLDSIKSRLDRGYYKRLDQFQRDMFICFERARKLSRTDSQLFEDAVELNSFFIRIRDEECGNGFILKSPALNYTQENLMESVERLREEKKNEETPQEEEVNLSEVKKEENSVIQFSQSEVFNDITYCVGDFVYVLPSCSGTSRDPFANQNQNNLLKPNIANIQKLWTEADGTKMFEGIWFFRPDQTYHLPTRKFLEKEVFRSEVRSTAKLSEITGTCWVMTVKGKEYFNFAPVGYRDEDVYVCEYRYTSRGRSFTKLKSWAFGSDRVKLMPRKNVLEPIRVASVFSDRVSNVNEDLPIEAEESPTEDLENVVVPSTSEEQNDITFFEQYGLPFGVGPIRSGDYVYVRVEDAKKLVARVDTMWSSKDGELFFHGPWFTSLDEISPSSYMPGRTFYKQEIFQSSIEDTNPLLSICGRCQVLELEDYIKYRITEIKEEDIFLCESMYEEARRQITKFDGLRKVVHISPKVRQDEIYFFKKPLKLIKIDAEGNIVPEIPGLGKVESVESPCPSLSMKLEQDIMMEDSMDTPSLASSETASLVGVSSPSFTTQKKKEGGKKVVTGYILYSSEVRKSVCERNPQLSFGEISRLIGNQWRLKSAAEKHPYEERASILNKEKGLTGNGHEGTGHGKNKDASRNEVELMNLTNALKKDPDWIFECCWATCDWQFEDALDLIEHGVQEPNGHVATTFKGCPRGTEFQCQWKNCARLKKNAKSFPTLSRLLKHVKDIHILKGNGRVIHPEMRSKNFVVASQISKPKARSAGNKKAGTASASQQQNGTTFVMPPTISSISFSSPTHVPLVTQPQVSVQVTPVVKPQSQAPPAPEALFVAVPPRPQKLLHSEAYIRYIESLHNKGQRHMTNWEKTLKATKENTSTPDPEKLPSHWLANGSEGHGSTVHALWALRDFMMRDALHLRKILE